MSTRGDTRQLLAEGLFVHIAWEPDPADHSVFTAQPGDEPILEAYAKAATVFYAASLGALTTGSPAWIETFVDAGAKFDTAFAEARASGTHVEFGQGVLLRPYVLADQRDEDSAVIYDCILSHEQWVSSDVPYVALPAAELFGTRATAVRVNGRWIIDQVTTGPACS